VPKEEGADGGAGSKGLYLDISRVDVRDLEIDGI
jgi:hypothetical protein